MSAALSEVAAGVDPRTRLVRRVVSRAFSLSGVVPLGAFVVLHVAINARALHGDAAFAGAVRAVQGLPALAAVIETALVYLPLALHGGLGLWLVATGGRGALRPEPSPYSPVLRGWMRATGVLLVAFLAMHVAELRFPGAAGRLGHLDGGELATRLDADLSATWLGVPWRGLAYLVGTAAVTFHLAVGLWGPSPQRRGGVRASERGDGRRGPLSCSGRPCG